ncbi:putative phage integrase, partial [Pseudomonas syringae pv. actinidiae ICMP 19104]
MVTKQARKAAEAQAANDTFETLAREWRASRIGGWDAGTAKRIMDALERHVFPTFGQRRYPPRSVRCNPRYLFRHCSSLSARPDRSA